MPLTAHSFQSRTGRRDKLSLSCCCCTCRVPILAWDDAEAIRAQQEEEEAAAAAAEQTAGSIDNRGNGDWEEDELQEEYVTEGELLSLSGEA